MILKAFVLYDKVSEMYLQPMFLPNLGVCMRSLRDEISRGGDGNNLANHPGDYELCELGSYDQETGEFLPVVPPRVVCRVLDVVPVKQEAPLS